MISYEDIFIAPWWFYGNLPVRSWYAVLRLLLSISTYTTWFVFFVVSVMFGEMFIDGSSSGSTFALFATIGTIFCSFFISVGVVRCLASFVNGRWFSIVFDVLCKCCRWRWRCPWIVAVDGGRWCCTNFVVKPGHVQKWFCLIACSHVEGTREKQATCRYRTRYRCVCFFLMMTPILLCVGITLVLNKLTALRSSCSWCAIHLSHCRFDMMLILYRRWVGVVQGFGGLVTVRVDSCFSLLLLGDKYRPECVLGSLKFDSEIHC